MKLHFKEDPKEWRKSALLTALGLAVLGSLLRWRHHLSAPAWFAILAVLAAATAGACLQPRWFRGYYRLSLRLGFFLSQWIGRAVLLGVFLLVVTPLGWALRLAGKDPLQLRRRAGDGTCWHPAKTCSPLERLF